MRILLRFILLVVHFYGGMSLEVGLNIKTTSTIPLNLIAYLPDPSILLYIEGGTLVACLLNNSEIGLLLLSRYYRIGVTY